MAPAAAPTPVPISAPFPAPYPVPAPTAAPAPAPTAVPVTVPHAVATDAATINTAAERKTVRMLVALYLYDRDLTGGHYLPPNSRLKKVLTLWPKSEAPCFTLCQALLASGSAAFPESSIRWPAAFAPSTTVLP